MTTLNSSSRYSLSEAPNGYIFTTDYGNEYLVTFSDLTSIINLKGLKIYDFGIEVIKRNSVKNDKFNGKLKKYYSSITFPVVLQATRMRDFDYSRHYRQ